jgi:hypothetical protein
MTTRNRLWRRLSDGHTCIVDVSDEKAVER